MRNISSIDCIRHSPHFSPGFRMEVHLSCFCVRVWTEKHSNGLKEDAYAEALQICMERNSTAPNTLYSIEIELRDF